MLKSHLSWSQNGTKEHTWRCFWLLKVRHVNTAQITELGREDHACLSLGHLLLSFCLSVCLSTSQYRCILFTKFVRRCWLWVWDYPLISHLHEILQSSRITEPIVPRVYWMKHTVIVHLITMTLFFHVDSALSYVFYVTIHTK